VIDPTGYAVRIMASAERDMKPFPSAVFRRISEAILSLESAPRPRACKRLRGREEYRMRVGDYRILYRVDDASRTVDVVAVGHRKDVYR
jgi:mRNA interferase RelE/StbE